MGARGRLGRAAAAGPGPRLVTALPMARDWPLYCLTVTVFTTVLVNIVRGLRRLQMAAYLHEELTDWVHGPLLKQGHPGPIDGPSQISASEME